ncbi:MAG: AbrB/MazE/SpoVT family DNA-binding domain-containing protein [Candidatus Bathyarchaeia archaeon]
MSVQVKVDSKGRICIPSELREGLGETVTVKRAGEGILIIPGKPRDFLEEFHEVIASEPPRTGIPENWPPERMKAVWRES